jgi:Ca2+-transporting ATPase
MAETTATQQKWFTLTPEAAEQQLKVDPAKGLSTAEAKQRLGQYGPNELAAKKKESGWQAFLRQYQDFMQIVLVAAAVINIVVTGEWGTTIVLLLLTVFNAVLALRGEAKAEASMEALQGTMEDTTRVRRDGDVVEVDASQLVPGDIVLLQAGDRVPADGRLIEAATLEIEESALTGESVASSKNTDVIDKADAPLGDRHNMGYMNTGVTRGSAEMIVTTTGMGTQMGSIADLLNKTESDKTPLQKQLDKLTIIIAGAAGVAFLIMIILGLMNDQPLDTVFVAGIALAIAAIPTGLPAVVTTMYSMGARTLAGLGAIVKRLPSVETLGSVSAVCTDKTGTLTMNKMTSVEFTIPGQNHYTVTGKGYSPEGKLLNDGGTQIDLTPVLMPMALCADATLDGDELVGDPTEGALIVLAAKGGIDLEGVRNKYPRLAVLPFDAAYKFMATFHDMTNEQGKPVVRCMVKGAPDVVIGRSNSVLLPDGEIKPLGDKGHQVALDENQRIGEEGERAMAVARRDFDPETFDPNADLLEISKDLTLLGIVGIVDPPRAEAKDAIAKCHSAGIQVRMITGDHAVTAAAIGKQLGIEGTALTGAQFAAKSDDEAIKEMPDIAIVARVTPQDKIRMVTLLQRLQNIVSMTGDGVNDAPALKKADIGVAMGITGTEVSKGAAVMILTAPRFPREPR